MGYFGKLSEKFVILGFFFWKFGLFWSKILIFMLNLNLNIVQNVLGSYYMSYNGIYRNFLASDHRIIGLEVVQKILGSWRNLLRKWWNIGKWTSWRVSPLVTVNPSWHKLEKFRKMNPWQVSWVMTSHPSWTFILMFLVWFHEGDSQGVVWHDMRHEPWRSSWSPAWTRMLHFLFPFRSFFFQIYSN